MKNLITTETTLASATSTTKTGDFLTSIKPIEFEGISRKAPFSWKITYNSENPAQDWELTLYAYDQNRVRIVERVFTSEYPQGPEITRMLKELDII